MATRIAAALILLASSFAFSRQDPPKAQVGGDEAFKSKVQPLLQKYCYTCHGATKPEGEFNITKFTSEKSVQEARAAWKEVLTKLHTREMPPKEKPQPTPAERATITDWIEATLDKLDESGKRQAGRVPPRRLNRTEYRNTVRDLLGVDFNPNADFPADDIGYGFDNIGDVLSLPPLLMEKYVTASKKIADLAIKEKLIFITTPDKEKTKRDAAKTILTKLASRAYRRPVAGDEVDKLLKLYDVGEKNEASFEAALKLPIRALLVSPHFLFRIEPDGAAETNAVSEFELASRLSYFLWSTMPDDELFEEARKGTLRKNLDAQVLRLLKDPKSIELAENFATQWLQVRRLEAMKFDPAKFPGYDPDLRDAMLKEVVLFFDSIVRDDRPIYDLVDADYTFLNERLAKHYGIDSVGDFKRVKLTDRRRGGVLTMAAVLAATSDPNRTSIVKRGKWVLESILGIEPPPPIPDAANLKEDKEGGAMTLRQRMEKHRADPNCAGCHAKMDPIGFGFENYDATGAWREKDGDIALDTAATLPDGKSFKGPIELKDILKARKAEFLGCFIEKLLTYGLGRGVEYFDGVAVKEIAAAATKLDAKFSAVIIEIVKSYPFQNRQRMKK